MSGNRFGGRIVFWGLTGAWCSGVIINIVICYCQKIFNNISSVTAEKILLASIVCGAVVGGVTAIIYEYSHGSLEDTSLYSEYNKSRWMSSNVKEVLIIIGINLVTTIILIASFQFMDSVKFL